MTSSTHHRSTRHRVCRTALLLIALLLSVPALQAQVVIGCGLGPPCTISFLGPDTQVLTLPGGCQVRVTFSFRFGCPGTPYEFVIHSVEQIGGGCGTLSAAQLINLTTRELLDQNPMGFPPYAPNSCVTIMRTLVGSCWRRVPNPCFPGDTILTPCDSNQCCTFYEMCLDSAWNKRILRGLTFGKGECDTNASAFCTPICTDTTEDPSRIIPVDESPSLSRTGKGIEQGDGVLHAPASRQQESAPARAPGSEPVSSRHEASAPSPSQPLHQHHR